MTTFIAPSPRFLRDTHHPAGTVLAQTVKSLQTRGHPPDIHRIEPVFVYPLLASGSSTHTGTGNAPGVIWFQQLCPEVAPEHHAGEARPTFAWCLC
jgi:hypothetical protein